MTDLLLDPAAPQGSGMCVLCGIDPLAQVDHSSVTTRAAPDAVLIVDGVFRVPRRDQRPLGLPRLAGHRC
ncbi:hypothetical protein [Actinoalloteichus sp. AHMU CJ021]|uniref:hypothetical protein n=1 Tax=Actinoalloteichus sp. AHMU CJ021 TaxID=2072503 RepID=UPI0004024F49